MMVIIGMKFGSMNIETNNKNYILSGKTMKKLETISSKISELSKELWQLMRDIPPCCIEKLNEISKICELHSRIADALMDTIKYIAYAKAEPNYETCCIYLEEAIKDLMSGMDAVDMLYKYDNILYDLRNPKPEHRGYRAKILTVDDLCNIDKEKLKEMLKE